MNRMVTIEISLLISCIVILLIAPPSVQFNAIFRKGASRQHDIKNGNRFGEPPWQKDGSFVGNSNNNQQFRFRIDTVSLDDAQRTTVEIIGTRGYPVEIHQVITDDGYKLELHRIPYGIGQSPYVKRRPVFLQHGFLNTDNVWLITPTNQGLAYILADLGFDVWLGNARGNTYSRNHTFLDPEEKDYWNFSFDEMGRYDLPAVIRYVLDRTERSKMSYIGHSMGCAIFFICMTYHPELNEKIDVMIALAPASSIAESETGIRYQAPFVNQLLLLYKILGLHLYASNDSLQHKFRKKFCGPSLFLRHSICKNPVFGTAGDDYRNLDLNLLPVIDGHNPAGTSVRTAAHFAQNYNAGQTFQPYDFGPFENQLLYGQPTPPAYDLSKVTCPVFIFWGKRDKVVAPGDVAWLASKLGNLQASIPVEDPSWNHQDHLVSPDAKRLVYDRFIPLLPNPLS